MKLERNIHKALTESINRNYKTPTKFTLGVSGGSDSQCLLVSFPRVARELGHDCIAVGINHGLRNEANSELDLAENLALKINVPFYRKVVKVIDGPEGIQSHARKARYDALFEYGNVIVTAHHFDDYAETVMIRLLRGKNIGSLNVLPEVSNNGIGIFRPLLSVPKNRILAHLKRWNILYANDPSNENMDYLRVKVRKEILPLLESINPQIKNRLVEISQELQIGNQLNNL